MKVYTNNGIEDWETPQESWQLALTGHKSGGHLDAPDFTPLGGVYKGMFGFVFVVPLWDRIKIIGV